MRLLLFASVGILLFTACQPGSQGTEIPTDLSEYELTDVPGEGLQRVEKKYEDGALLEEGYLLNGQRTGTWFTYELDSPYPQKIMTYAGGMANGPYFELNERGQIELKAYYKNNQLHGRWATYKFNRVIKEANYQNGQLDGVYREYQIGNGKIQKEIQYKNGQIDGRYLFYDEEGNVMLDYQYKNGKKIGE